VRLIIDPAEIGLEDSNVITKEIKTSPQKKNQVPNWYFTKKRNLLILVIRSLDLPIISQIFGPHGDVVVWRSIAIGFARFRFQVASQQSCWVGIRLG